MKLRHAAAAAGTLSAAYAAITRLRDQHTEIRPVQKALTQAQRVLPDKQRTAFQKWTLKQVYEQVSKSSGDSNSFLNYGFAALEEPYTTLDLPEDQVDDRTGMQLYNHIASAVELKGLEALEVGCGRGGGTSFVFDRLGLRRMVGVDLAERAVADASRIYGRPGLTYEVGDAENLRFNNESFDAVLNVESSHCYPNMDRFLAEVFRVLRPGGHLLIADLRPAEDVGEFRSFLVDSGLEIVVEEDITANVVKALEIDSDRRVAMIESTAPKASWAQMKDFAGVAGTPGFGRFADREVLYTRFVARRPAPASVETNGVKAGSIPRPPTVPESS